jgi:Presenilin
MIAVTTGLTLTIFLLVVYEKPLPALPISIAFGILFYFVASILMSPMIHELVTGPQFVPIRGALFVGTDGAGFTYL